MRRTLEILKLVNPLIYIYWCLLSTEKKMLREFHLFYRKHFSSELEQSKLVRFIFNGRDLQNDSSTLESYNICDNSVLHCLITQRQQNETRQMDNDNGFDIGMFMFPLFGLLLACIWYLRFTYRQLFNTTSTLTLGGITFLFVAAFISTLQRPANHEHID